MVLVVVLLVVADRRLALPLLHCFLCYFSSPLSLLFFSSSFGYIFLYMFYGDPKMGYNIIHVSEGINNLEST